MESLITNSSNVKYNEDTDMIQILYEGEWTDWRSANIQIPHSINTSNMTVDDWEDYLDSGAIWKKSSPTQFTITNGGWNANRSIITKQTFKFSAGTMFVFASNIGANNPWSRLSLLSIFDNVLTQIKVGSGTIIIPNGLADKEVRIIVGASSSGIEWESNRFSLYTQS